MKTNQHSILTKRIAPAALALLGLAGPALAQYTGEFSAVGMGTGDSDALVGLSTAKTYLNAVNLGSAANVTVNGVTFIGAGAVGNPSVAGQWAFTGVPTVFGGGGTNPGGQLGVLTNQFVYNNATEVLTLSNLTIGETYVVTTYNRSWEAAGARTLNMTASGASVVEGGFVFDQGIGATAQGSLTLLRYTFQATSTTQTITFTQTGVGTGHQYGFTNERVYNNTFTSGTNWTTATWSGGVPNARGANAAFNTAGGPINLDADVTVGHLQFDNATPWTLSTSSARTLTMQTDVGGVSTLSAKAGAHTVSTNISLLNNLLKVGAGSVTVSGDITGGAVSIHNAGGTLRLEGTNTYRGETIFAGGSVTEVTTLSDYGVPSAIGARQLADENLTVTGVGLHFQGGTLRFVGSTPQSTNRHIRVLNGATGGTIEASGTNPAATLSFTQSGPNINLFDTPGTRTLTLGGTNTGNNLFAIPLTNQGTNATSLTKAGTGTWELSSAANTYTGTTLVKQGTLNLTGARTAAAGAITVGDTGGSNAILNIQNGTFTVGTVTVATTGIAAQGTINQTGGSITMSGTQMIVGNGNGSGSQGFYNLSAGTLTGAASANRGVILGTNTGTTGTFNLSGTGILNLATAALQVARSEVTAANTTTGVFNQSGGTATVGTLGVGGLDAAQNASASGTMNFSAGTFSANAINAFGGGNNSVAAINISGTALVTLPGLPTVRGTGATTTFTFDGGTLRAGASSATYMENLTSAQIKNGGFNFDTNGHLITINQALVDFPGHTGALTKAGAGTLTLGGANTYTGATTVNAGSLIVNGALGSGAVSIANGATLGGAGTIAGAVTTVNGARITPGASVGLLTVGSLTLGTGTVLDYEFNPVNDRINVTNPGGLTINGGGINLYNEGTLTPFSTDGTYSLFGYVAGFGGSLANLSILNSQAGKLYTISDAGGTIDLTIANAPQSEWNGLAGDGLWSSGGNWTAGSPNAAGVVATFGLIPASPTAVAVNGPKTVGAIIFDNASGYTVSGGAGDAITLDNASAAAGITSTSGSHTLAAPLALTGNLSASVAAGAGLTITGDISGAGKTLLFNGPATLALGGANNYGATIITGGTLQIGTGGAGGSPGTGDVSVNSGATLAFNRNNALSIPNNITGAGAVSQTGTGTTTLAGTNAFATLNADSGTVVLAGTNTIGTINASPGTVRVGSATGLASGALVINGGTLDLDDFNATVTALSGVNGLITTDGATLGTSTLTVNQATNTTFDGAILDGLDRTVALVKTGGGILTLAGSVTNSFYGGTTITGGTLRLEKTAGNAIVSDITIGDASGSDILELGAANQIGDASVVTFTAGGSGNSAFFRINGFNDTVRGIKTTLANAAVLENNAPSGGTATLNVDTQGADFTYDGIIRNASVGASIFALTKSGAGTLTLKNTAVVAPNSYTGATTVNGGTLALDNLTAIGATPITINSGRLVVENLSGFGAASILINSPDAGALTVSTTTRNLTTAVPISGTGEFVKNGAFTLTLTGVGSFAGTTVVNDGTLGLGNNDVLGTSTIVMNGGNLRASGAGRVLGNPVIVNNSFTLGRLTDLLGPITLNADATITANNFDGPANNPSNLGPIGGGFRIGFAEGPQGIGTGSLNVTGVNTNAGGTLITSGRVNVTGTGQLSIAPLTVNGGEINLNNAAQSLTELSGTGGTLNLGSGHTLSLDQSTDTTFAGTIGGSGALVKSQPGRITLSGSNTLSGPTTINAGAVIVSGSLSGSAVAVNGGVLGGAGTAGNVTVTGGTVAPGASAGTLTLASLSLDAASTLDFELATPGIVGGGVNDLLSITGSLVLDGTLQITELPGFGNGIYRLANYGGAFADNGLDLTPAFIAAYPGSFVDTTTGGQVNLVVVPEPGSALLLLGGLAVLGARRKRTA